MARNANQTTNPGGTVTFSPAPGSGVAVRIERLTPLTQATAYSAFTAFPAKTHEASLDKLAMQTQDVDRKLADEAATRAASVASEAATRAAADAVLDSKMGIAAMAEAKWSTGTTDADQHSSLILSATRMFAGVYRIILNSTDATCPVATLNGSGNGTSITVAQVDASTYGVTTKNAAGAQVDSGFAVVFFKVQP